MRWTPDEKRKRGRPKEKWRQSMDREMKEKWWNLGDVGKTNGDKQQWRSMVKALFADTHEED